MTTRLPGAGRPPTMLNKQTCIMAPILMLTTRGTENLTSHREERAEVEAVLSSQIFARAPNLCKMLSYVCERCFHGEAASVKEYNIAVEALGRSMDFDPERDSIVRVEASRLRKRLKQYYEGQGATHPIHIVLPEIGYVPRFVPLREPASQLELSEEDTSGALTPRGTKFSRRKLAAGAAGVILAVSVVVTVALLVGSRSRSGNAAGRDTRIEPDLARQNAGASPADSQPEEVRILAGYTGPKYIDRMGRTWLGDRWFTGGRAFAEPSRRVFRTLDQGLYQSGRMGEFRYQIPLRPGVYELHLHFAETQYIASGSLESGAEGLRKFHVSLNGKPILQDFDITSNAGAPSTADERIFRDVSPANDGFLHLDFSSSDHGTALVNAIEIFPGLPGKMRPVRIMVGSRVYVDKRGEFWGADRYFLGGRVSRQATPIADDLGLYDSQRWGNFSYAIPVAEGRYTVTLRFAEPTFGLTGQDGADRRLFDLYCNGTALLRNFDIFKEAGAANRRLVKTFRGLEPNAQGKLLFSFVPVKNYANVYAIEVAPE